MLRKIVFSGAAAAFIAVAGMVSGTAPANAGVHVSVGIPGIFGFWGPGYYYAPPPPPAAYYGPYAYYGYGPGYYGYRRGYYGYRRGYYGYRRGYYGGHYDHRRYDHRRYYGRARRHDWR